MPVKFRKWEEREEQNILSVILSIRVGLAYSVCRTLKNSFSWHAMLDILCSLPLLVGMIQPSFCTAPTGLNLAAWPFFSSFFAAPDAAAVVVVVLIYRVRSIYSQNQHSDSANFVFIENTSMWKVFMHTQPSSPPYTYTQFG